MSATATKSMWPRRMGSARRLLTALAVFTALAWQPGATRAEDPALTFEQLPPEVREYVDGVHKSCKELDPELQPSYPLQGITVIDLEGDGARDLMVDAEELCNTRTAGGNCSNRGCDLKIWKQTGAGAWSKIFDEHLHRKFLMLSDNGRLKLMAVSVYAGNDHCNPDPTVEYTSGQSCDALVRYRKGRWLWEKIE